MDDPLAPRSGLGLKLTVEEAGDGAVPSEAEVVMWGV